MIRSIRAIEGSDVCILMLDATRGVESQDLNIFSLIQKNQKGLVVVINKWDLVEDKSVKVQKTFEEAVRSRFAPFVDFPIIFASALTKQRILKVLEEVDVKGISHITGGGFYENIPRSLKKGCCARIKKEDVRTPALFHLMQKTGNISEHDMFNTFNMGVGMVLTVPAEQADKALEILHANGEPEAYRLGVIAEGEGVELC